MSRRISSPFVFLKLLGHPDDLNNSSCFIPLVSPVVYDYNFLEFFKLILFFPAFGINEYIFTTILINQEFRGQIVAFLYPQFKNVNPYFPKKSRRCLIQAHYVLHRIYWCIFRIINCFKDDFRCFLLFSILSRTLLFPRIYFGIYLIAFIKIVIILPLF